MKKILFILVAVFIIAGCAGPDYTRQEKRIPPENSEKAATFIKELCAVSNPHSDEEPEDMIRQAYLTAIELYGVSYTITYNHSHHQLKAVREEPNVIQESANTEKK